MILRSRLSSFVSLALLLTIGPFSLAQTGILGFTPASAQRQQTIEQKFKAIPSPEEEKRQHRIFTREPHIAGSDRNNKLARYIADEWKRQGLEDIVMRRYDVYTSFPKSTSLRVGRAGEIQSRFARGSL